MGSDPYSYDIDYDNKYDNNKKKGNKIVWCIL